MVMISGRGSNLAALITACNNPNYPAKITAVISDHANAGGLKIAKDSGIDGFAFERSGFKSKQAHEVAILECLKNYEPSLICLAGYMRILSVNFVRQYTDKILNIHPSLLPKYPGLNTHARALDAGDIKHGCTVHFVDEKLDAGPIVAQGSVDIEPGDDVFSLEKKVLKIEHKLYVDAVQRVLSACC